jgi:hypothetical protein
MLDGRSAQRGGDDDQTQIADHIQPLSAVSGNDQQKRGRWAGLRTQPTVPAFSTGSSESHVSYHRWHLLGFPPSSTRDQFLPRVGQHANVDDAHPGQTVGRCVSRGVSVCNGQAQATT